ncbi:hypothetical protein [Deinococcus sp. NW-56]|uniref:hypothetical protein n=1 Tax=Deinococcus sp. NW-56 TaxID=2080419 RepID=UPI000CF4E8D5|nr:hypothetical protein [Deinococcus sp. NW-56]
MILVAALLGWQAQRLALGGAPLKADATPRTCTTPPRFRVGYPAEAAPPSLPDQAFNFMGNSWLVADICAPGSLRITAEGQAAGGDAPHLEVALNSQVIWQGEFTGRREVNIPVPGPGHLTLGYFNDYYRSEYRNAVLERVNFEGRDGCEAVEVTVPENAGGAWDPNGRTVSWLFAPQVTLRPCAAGTLTLQAYGQSGGGTFSTLAFAQNGRELRRVRLSEVHKELRLNVASSPVQIRILNPYFQELGDRNLYLKAVVFSPNQ